MVGLIAVQCPGKKWREVQWLVDVSSKEAGNKYGAYRWRILLVDDWIGPEARGVTQHLGYLHLDATLTLGVADADTLGVVDA